MTEVPELNNKSKPSVFVILVNWNTAKVTIDCIQSILRTDYQPLKICLIDNGSAEKELDILRKGIPDCVSLHCMGENLGYVGGVNYALKMAETAKPDYILIMNNDTLIDSKAIQQLVSTAEKHSNMCLVTGKVLDFNKPDVIQQIGSFYRSRKLLKFQTVVSNQTDYGQYDFEMELDMIDDVFWLLPYRVFEQTGFYNSRFWFNREQADYALRVSKNGNKLIYTPYAKIWHMGSHTIGGRSNNPVREYYDMKSILMLRYIHICKANFVFFYAETLLKTLANFSAQIIKLLLGRPRSLRIALAGILGVIDFTVLASSRLADTGNYPKILDPQSTSLSTKRAQ